MNAGFYHPVSAAINKWFIRRRGLAFSVIIASGSFGGMIMAPFLSYIILTHGWRRGLGVVGLAYVEPLGEHGSMVGLKVKGRIEENPGR